MKKITVFLLLLICIGSFAAGTFWQKTQQDAIESNIYKQAKVKKSTGDWGSIYMYTDDQTTTYGTNSMLTAVLEFLPGKQLQPPHQHPEEEFSFIISGSGTWSLNGVESQITKGDLMYAKPGDWHGIKNTGKDTLQFFVMKWSNKGVELPMISKD